MLLLFVSLSSGQQKQKVKEINLFVSETTESTCISIITVVIDNMTIWYVRFGARWLAMFFTKRSILNLGYQLDIYGI